MLSTDRREALFWIFQTLFWTSVGVIGLLMTLAFKSAIPGVGLTIFIRMATGFVETAVLRELYRRSLFRRRSGPAQWLLAAGCCLALAALEVLMMQLCRVAGLALPGGVETVGIRLLVVRLFILAVWSSLYFTFHVLESAHALELRTTKAELDARKNELRSLQAQMNPHFVFNALNGVLACKGDATAVQEVTQGLADYLRFLLEETRPLEPLSRELDALEKYLTVQSSHVGGKLVCRMKCEKAAGTVMVPPMMVQPMLEDAFQHRAQADDLPLQIWVTARIEDRFLRVTVSHTSDRATTEDPPPPGKGVRALEQRILLLLGPQAAMERQVDKGWIRVTIHVPLT
jgi:hypothetical protein